jgi:hypothetical protein
VVDHQQLLAGERLVRMVLIKRGTTMTKTDIVERLRRGDCEEAAAEIERLRIFISNHASMWKSDQGRQIEHLRGALITISGYMNRWQIDDNGIRHELDVSIGMARAVLQDA